MQRQKESLIRELELLGHLKTLHIRDALLEVRRSDFLPPALLPEAFRNIPLTLPSGSVISQPSVVAFILEQAYFQKGNRTILFGCGSGWEANIIASLVDTEEKSPEHPGPFVRAIIPSEAERIRARVNSRRFGFEERGVLKFDGNDEHAFDRPADRVVGFRKIPGGIPRQWKENLAVHGRIVVPEGDSILVLEKTGGDDFEEKRFFGFHFPEDY